MKFLLFYIGSFLQIVVVNCVIFPENWDSCRRIGDWLVPDVIEGYKIWTGRKIPYQEEKDYLKSVQ